MTSATNSNHTTVCQVMLSKIQPFLSTHTKVWSRLKPFIFFFPLLQQCSIPCPQEGQLLPHFRLFRISLQWEFSFSFIFITRSPLGSSSHCPTFCIPSNTSHFHPDPGNLPPIPDITSILVAKIGCRPPVAHCLCQAPLCFNPCRHCCLGKTMLRASHQALRSFLVFNSATVPN